MALIKNTAASILEGQETLPQATLDLRLDEITRNPEFAIEQLKITLSLLQQVLQVANRQEVLVFLARDVSLSVSQRRLLTELLGEGSETLSGNRDELTGLLTRSSLLEWFSQEPYKVGKAKGPLAICFIDLDGFKAINDQHGHAIGDQVLVAIGERIQTAIRPTDLVVRWGGDEFIVVFEGVQTSDLAMQLASRLLGIISAPLQLNPSSPMRLFLGASIGIAIRADQKLSATELIDQADQAMYQAKKSGQNSVQVFS
jgi:diguanylate cyclase (GGDEF)-like protein